MAGTGLRKDWYPRPMLANAGAVQPDLLSGLRTLPRIWAARDLILGLVVAVGGSLLIVLAVAGVLVVTGGAEGSAGRIGAAIAAVALEALLGLWVVLRAWARGISWAELGFVPPRRWGPLWIAWFGSYGILIGYQGVVQALKLIGVDVSRFARGNSLPIDMTDGGGVLLLLGIAVVGLAPLCEELFFRALWFRGLRGFWSFGPAALLSGLLFGVFHLNPSVVLPFTMIGVLFAWSNDASGSIYTSIAAHGAVNALSFVLTIILVGNAELVASAEALVAIAGGVLS